jgi:hypothetical protein
MMMLQVLLKLELAWQPGLLVSEQLLQLALSPKLVEFELAQQVLVLQLVWQQELGLVLASL